MPAWVTVGRCANYSPPALVAPRNAPIRNGWRQSTKYRYGTKTKKLEPTDRLSTLPPNTSREKNIWQGLSNKNALLITHQPHEIMHEKVHEKVHEKFWAEYLWAKILWAKYAGENLVAKILQAKCARKYARNICEQFLHVIFASNFVLNFALNFSQKFCTKFVARIFVRNLLLKFSARYFLHKITKSCFVLISVLLICTLNYLLFLWIIKPTF